MSTPQASGARPESFPSRLFDLSEDTPTPHVPIRPQPERDFPEGEGAEATRLQPVLTRESAAPAVASPFPGSQTAPVPHGDLHYSADRAGGSNRVRAVDRQIGRGPEENERAGGKTLSPVPLARQRTSRSKSDSPGLTDEDIISTLMGFGSTGPKQASRLDSVAAAVVVSQSPNAHDIPSSPSHLTSPSALSSPESRTRRVSQKRASPEAAIIDLFTAAQNTELRRQQMVRERLRAEQQLGAPTLSSSARQRQEHHGGRPISKYSVEYQMAKLLADQGEKRASRMPLSSQFSVLNTFELERSLPVSPGHGSPEMRLEPNAGTQEVRNGAAGNPMFRNSGSPGLESPPTDLLASTAFGQRLERLPSDFGQPYAGPDRRLHHRRVRSAEGKAISGMALSSREDDDPPSLRGRQHEESLGHARSRSEFDSGATPASGVWASSSLQFGPPGQLDPSGQLPHRDSLDSSHPAPSGRPAIDTDDRARLVLARRQRWTVVEQARTEDADLGESTFQPGRKVVTSSVASVTRSSPNLTSSSTSRFGQRRTQGAQGRLSPESMRRSYVSSESNAENKQFLSQLKGLLSRGLGGSLQPRFSGDALEPPASVLDGSSESRRSSKNASLGNSLSEQSLAEQRELPASGLSSISAGGRMRRFGDNSQSGPALARVGRARSGSPPVAQGELSRAAVVGGPEIPGFHRVDTDYHTHFSVLPFSPVEDDVSKFKAKQLGAIWAME